MPFKPPLRTNEEVSLGTPSPLRFLFAPDLYKRPWLKRGSRGSGLRARGGPPPARVAVTRDITPRKQDAGMRHPPSVILKSISSETVAGASFLTPVFASSVRTPEIRANASQPRDSGASTLSRDVPVTDTAPAVPFRYTREIEAKIWGEVLQANYPLAYGLFEPSERPKVIDGGEVTRFVSEHPDKVTMAGRRATRLWVCQATAKWATDGSVSYTPTPCGTACTSWDICRKHICTQHLARKLPEYKRNCETK
jgi:hypothetical protein